MAANLRVMRPEPIPDILFESPAERVATAEDQVDDAIAELDSDPNRVLRLPWDALDALTGPMGGGGDIWLAAGFSGNGKTTFVCSAIERWMNAGKRVYIMPLETQPKRFRAALACQTLELYAGDVLSGQLRSQVNGEDVRRALKTALHDQTRSPFVDRVRIDERRMIDKAGLIEGMKDAKAFGADVMIVDHIDHIAGGDGKNAVADSRAVCHAALEMAQANGMLLLFTSQLNMDIARADRLAKYQPPQLQHLLYPSIKTHIATGIIGLFRPVREIGHTETKKDYQACLAAARTGLAEPSTVLKPYTMGVVLMKSRHYGAREGGRIELRLQNGKLIDA